MKADLTRKSFDLLKHFSQVLNQQGRVQLDADWNEQGGILLHITRQLAADGLGPAASSPQNGGFSIVPLALGTTTVGNDFGITPGTYYVNGILCELEATPIPLTAVNTSGNAITVANWTADEIPFATKQYVRLWNDNANPGTQPAAPASANPMPALAVSQISQTTYGSLGLTLNALPTGLASTFPPWNFIQRITSYLTQPDLPNPPALQTSSLIYLDVWERLITYIEDDSIREVALNGPDTAARARVVWQVKALPGQNGCVPAPQIGELLQPWTRGYLRARVSPAQVSTDPCTISPTSQYRGAENQLYRVEIHTGTIDGNGNSTKATPTFKWSRENGSVIYPVVKVAVSSNATTVTLGNLGRDDRYGLEIGDFVELQDDATVLNNITGALLQVQAIDATSLTVTLAGAAPANVGTDPTLHPLLRRWDHQSGDPTQGGETVAADGALPIPTASAEWLDLEDGVQVRFEVLSGVTMTYRSGDYWMIPARVATGNVIWPTETVTNAQGNAVTNPAARPPDGITHSYAPLAFLTLTNGVPSIEPCTGAQLTRHNP